MREKDPLFPELHFSSFLLLIKCLYNRLLPFVKMKYCVYYMHNLFASYLSSFIYSINTLSKVPSRHSYRYGMWCEMRIPLYWDCFPWIPFGSSVYQGVTQVLRNQPLRFLRKCLCTLLYLPSLQLLESLIQGVMETKDLKESMWNLMPGTSNYTGQSPCFYHLASSKV